MIVLPAAYTSHLLFFWNVRPTISGNSAQKKGGKWQ